MNQTLFTEKINEEAGKLPSEVKIFAVRQHSLPEVRERSKKLFRLFSEIGALTSDRGDWVQEKERTMVRLPRGARAVFYHASGNFKLMTGLKPFDHLFEKEQDNLAMEKVVRSFADKASIAKWSGNHGTLEFEHLWKVKAAATNREGYVVSPVLCRVIGAFRHMVDGIPVLGAASVAIKMAAGNKLDSLSSNIREVLAEPIAWSPIISVDEAAKRIWLQLGNLKRNSKEFGDEKLTITSLRFGYLALGKREVQQVMSPHFIATINIDGKEEAQGYQFVVSATENTYLPLSTVGSHPTNYFAQRKHGKLSQNGFK